MAEIRTSRSLRAFLLGSILTLQSAFGAAAQTILTVADDRKGLDASMSEEIIDAFPQVAINTANEFVDGIVRFEGPRAVDVLERVTGPASRLGDVDIRFTAANDYQVDVPLSDLTTYGVILATQMDGKRLSRRDKGPIWLIYPMSDYPELQNSVYNARLIWQVTRMEVAPSVR